MTAEELDALAVRLVACPHFKPMPGMRDLQGRTWTPDLMWRWNRTIDRPDLSDPATMGCLLALVRAARYNTHLCAVYDPTDGHWFVGHFEGDRYGFRPLAPGGWTTEAEAWVAALEAAS